MKLSLKLSLFAFLFATVNANDLCDYCITGGRFFKPCNSNERMPFLRQCLEACKVFCLHQATSLDNVAQIVQQAAYASGYAYSQDEEEFQKNMFLEFKGYGAAPRANIVEERIGDLPFSKSESTESSSDTVNLMESANSLIGLSQEPVGDDEAGNHDIQAPDTAVSLKDDRSKRNLPTLSGHKVRFSDTVRVRHIPNMQTPDTAVSLKEDRSKRNLPTLSGRKVRFSDTVWVRQIPNKNTGKRYPYKHREINKDY